MVPLVNFLQLHEILNRLSSLGGGVEDHADVSRILFERHFVSVYIYCPELVDCFILIWICDGTNIFNHFPHTIWMKIYLMLLSISKHYLLNFVTGKYRKKRENIIQDLELQFYNKLGLLSTPPHKFEFQVFTRLLVSGRSPESFDGSFSFPPPHLQIFTCNFVDHIVRL